MPFSLYFLKKVTKSWAFKIFNLFLPRLRNVVQRIRSLDQRKQRETEEEREREGDEVKGGERDGLTKVRQEKKGGKRK